MSFEAMIARRPFTILSFKWFVTSTHSPLANILPIMTVTYFGAGTPDTIMSGIIQLLQLGSYPVAAVIFIASILVPLLKMVALLILLLSVQFKWVLDDRQRTRGDESPNCRPHDRTSWQGSPKLRGLR